MELIVGISGASGVIYGLRLLEVLASMKEMNTHLVITEAARLMVGHETDWTLPRLESLATCVYDPRDIGACVSSGSFRTAGMVVVPCSIKTASAIAHSSSGNLLARAADVTLKEKRRLVLVVRETPLHLGHLRIMVQLAEIGAVVMPPVPAFYHQPKTLDDIIDQMVGRVLDQFSIEHNLYERWAGLKALPSDDE